MAVQTYNLGVVTAYGDARAGGYTGTLEEWRELMASYATVGQQAAQSASDAQASANLAQQRADSITNLVAVAQTLPKESSATANYADGVLTLGIPRGDGDKGDKGDKGDVGPAPAVTITRITGGHRLTITDDTGDHSCDIMDGAGSVNDVLVNGNSVLNSGIATIPTASTTTYGVVKQYTTAQQDRNTNIAIFGNSAYILKNVGSALEATIINSNEIQISDGQLVAEGYVLEIPVNTTESLEIDSGTAGMLRTDLIVARYTKDISTDTENMQLVVIKGTPAASNPATPAYNTGSIANGDSPVDFPVYKVNISGTSINSVECIVATTQIMYKDDLLARVALDRDDVTINAGQSYVWYGAHVPVAGYRAKGIAGTRLYDATDGGNYLNCGFSFCEVYWNAQLQSDDLDFAIRNHGTATAKIRYHIEVLYQKT